MKADVATFVRFMSFVNIPASPGECWIWTGNAPDGRYGHFSLDAKIIKAHRWMYEYTQGEIPDGLLIRHKCDNPKCVNPLHLETGTPAQNMRDKYDRGRAPDRRGSKHPMARLTEGQVRDIRRLASCGIPHHSIAQRLGVSRGHVQGIVSGKRWSHVQ